MKAVDKYLNELKDKWNLSDAELFDVRVAMNMFAISAIMDSAVEKEVVKDLDKIQNKNGGRFR